MSSSAQPLVAPVSPTHASSSRVVSAPVAEHPTEWPNCTKCHQPNEFPRTYKMCEACRRKAREQSRQWAERKKEKMRVWMAETSMHRQSGSSKDTLDKREPGLGSSLGPPGPASRALGQRPAKKQKRVHDPSLEHQRKKRPSQPLRAVDPDEYQFFSEALTALAEARQRVPTRLDFRFVFAVVATEDITHQKRIDMVVSALREKSGLVFSLNSKLQEPGSNAYARHNAITERYRCKCIRASAATASAPSGNPSPLRRKQSLLHQWVTTKPKDSAGEDAKEERCGGLVYVSSEWDTRSHPSRVKGQRIVVCIVHPDAART